MKQGFFVTFEGPDGSGKTTQMQQLAQILRGQGYRVLTTREPGGTRLGDGVRALLLDRDHTEMHPRTETLLFNAARAQLVHQVIRPALEAGTIVLCDRYADSTLAYQGYGYGQDLEILHNLIEYATGGLKPDLTLYIDVSPETGLRRKQAGAEWNRLDAQAVAFHQAVHRGYQALIAAEPERWIVVDGEQAPEIVAEAVYAAVAARLPRLHRERERT